MDTPTPTTTPATPAIIVPRKSITVDPSKIPQITLIPHDRIKRAAKLVEDATTIVSIDSVAALGTADELASTMKGLENEIENTTKEHLEPVKTLLAQASESVKAVLEPLQGARKALAERVVEAKGVLGYTEATHCYSSTVAELRILDADKIPATVRIPGKGGKPDEVVSLLKPDEAAIKRAIKAGVHVPGVYQGEKSQIGTKSAP